MSHRAIDQIGPLSTDLSVSVNAGNTIGGKLEYRENSKRNFIIYSPVATTRLQERIVNRTSKEHTSSPK